MPLPSNWTNFFISSRRMKEKKTAHSQKIWKQLALIAFHSERLIESTGKCRINCLFSSDGMKQWFAHANAPLNKSMNQTEMRRTLAHTRFTRTREQQYVDLILARRQLLLASLTFYELFLLFRLSTRRFETYVNFASIRDGLEWYLRLKYENRKHHVDGFRGQPNNSRGSATPQPLLLSTLFFHLAVFVSLCRRDRCTSYRSKRSLRFAVNFLLSDPL